MLSAEHYNKLTLMKRINILSYEPGRDCHHHRGCFATG